MEEVLLRQGNVHSDEDWLAVLEPIVARYHDLQIPRYFRTDAAFATPEIYEFLETNGYEYAIRLPSNDILLEEIAPMLIRPTGRPSNTPVVWYANFHYQAKTWDRARRVIFQMAEVAVP